jgi:hypothetical protein
VPPRTNGASATCALQVIDEGKLSGGTRSDQGRACRAAFLGLLLTCAKPGISFRGHLGHRLGVPGAAVPYLVRRRSAPA